ncbi:MAG: zinc-ribbon domain-containing protein [Candidatus Omnitrophica bacterium]|nr:zinc-ribbon domain-containing protein [Candidatus Omnitrophota bacterium]
MFCSECGKQVDNRDKFCPICGKQLDSTPTASGSFAHNQKDIVKTMDLPALVGSISLIISFFLPWIDMGLKTTNGFSFIMFFINELIVVRKGQFGIGPAELILICFVISEGVSLVGAGLILYFAYAKKKKFKALLLCTCLTSILILIFSYLMKRFESSLNLEWGLLFVLTGAIGLIVSLIKKTSYKGVKAANG